LTIAVAILRKIKNLYMHIVFISVDDSELTRKLEMAGVSRLAPGL
jgi:hypothetical protein